MGNQHADDGHVDVCHSVSLIKDFAYRLGQGLSVADNQFQARQRIVELLNVTAILTRENGQKVACVSCILGENIFELIKNRSGRNPMQWYP